MFIKNLNLETKKRVFLRADLNVPLENQTIMNDHKLNAIMPTIKLLQQHGHKIILATHIGRPPAQSQKNFFDENLSTKILAKWFKRQGIKIKYEIDLLKAQDESKSNFDEILLLENLRFFNGEKETSEDFSQILAQCADLYVNDAFGLLHRNDTSVTLLPQQFAPENRAFGLLVEKELKMLGSLKQNPEQPFIIALGGGKVASKINILAQFINAPETNKVKTIMLGGGIANTFLKAQKYNVGSSLIEEKSIPLALEILEQAKKQNVKILLPIDVFTASVDLDDQPEVHNINEIPQYKTIVDIGPKTIDLFSQEIAKAKTIFSNGTMGIYEKKDYETGTKAILEAIAKSDAHTIIGGGDAVAATYTFGLEKDMQFLSTGGGASLSLLASTDPNKDLPAMKAMLTDETT